MKITVQWLREWVNPQADVQAIVELFNLSGLEVDAMHAEDGDEIIDIDLTPNRGDCLSARGLARELAALTQTPLSPPFNLTPTSASIKDTWPVHLQSSDCPYYTGRVIRGINPHASTPEWLQKRLTQLGMQPVSPVVDVTNYVMLELGQPLHAFDLAQIKGDIVVRDAKPDEAMTLLDGTQAKLSPAQLVIADDEKALAVAGVMGSADSGVSESTQDIFLESTHFLAHRIAGVARQLGVNSEGAYRWERGVDPTLAQEGMHRLTQLLLEIVGGDAGPIIEVGTLPAALAPITLRAARINRILGVDFPQAQVPAILQRLGMQVSEQGEGTWRVYVPSFRFDIRLEIDLIEELARVYGYNQIPAKPLTGTLQALPDSEQALPGQRLRHFLVDQGYHELITYSFVNEALQNQLSGQAAALKLLNPIASQMNVMRRSLWPGLLQAVCYNQNRQQTQMRLFELGLCFLPEKDGLIQQHQLAAVINSQQTEKHWLQSARTVDFYTLKGEVEALLALTGESERFSWQAAQHPALHPGQSAELLKDGQAVGWLGQLHPMLTQQLDLKGQTFVFECTLAAVSERRLPVDQGISKFPAIRRDLAIVVDAHIVAADLSQVVAEQAGDLLQKIEIFDVYQGKGIDPDKKSVALGVILQSHEQTLVDAQVNAVMAQIITTLEQRYQATIRD